MNHRVVLLTDSLRPLCPSEQVYWLATQLAEQQFDVQLIALQDSPGPPSSDTIAIPGVSVHCLGWRRKLDAAKALDLVATLRRLSPKIIHAWGSGPGRLVRALAAAQQRWATLVTEFEPRAKITFLNGMLNRVGRSVKTLAVHDSLRPPHAHWPVISKGVGKAHGASSLSRESLLEQLRVPQGAKLIGTAAPLVPYSRLKDAIWATDLLHCIRDDVYLIMIGEGPQRWRLAQFGRQAEIAEHVRMIGWSAAARQIIPLLDLYWQPSAYWPIADATLLAMSRAVPVVAADTGSNRELVSHQTTGFLSAKGARDEMAKWANQLLDDSRLAAEIGQSGRCRVERRFPLDKMAAQYVHQYQLVL